jgi:hypothetical protein
MSLEQEYEHTFADIVPCDDLRFNDTLTQSLDNQYLKTGHAFPRQDTCAEGGVIFVYQGFLPCMMPSCHLWMDDKTDRWMEKASQKTTTTSFTICYRL